MSYLNIKNHTWARVYSNKAHVNEVIDQNIDFMLVDVESPHAGFVGKVK